MWSPVPALIPRFRSLSAKVATCDVFASTRGGRGGFEGRPRKLQKSKPDMVGKITSDASDPFAVK